MNTVLYHVAAAPFEAARHVDILPNGHQARRIHGHSFLARVRARLPEDWAPFPGGETAALTEALHHCVAPLNYRLLNDHLEVPTDENLARWVRACLKVPGIESVGIQSTHHQGADLDTREHVHVWHRFQFEAAHRLPRVPPGHPCGRMHGHSFKIILHADQDLGEGTMGVDFDYLELLWAPLQQRLDYTCLNDILGLENPTSEVLAGWIWRQLKPALPELSWVSVYETMSAGCHYDGARYCIWKEQRFEGALRLLHAPDGELRRRLHGHSYLVRLHLCAPLDEVMGWTVDYGDVKEMFKPIYQALDHHRLDEISELADADPASLAQWMRERMTERLPQLDRIDLYETPGCGAVLAWGNRGPALPV